VHRNREVPNQSSINQSNPINQSINQSPQLQQESFITTQNIPLPDVISELDGIFIFLYLFIHFLKEVAQIVIDMSDVCLKNSVCVTVSFLLCVTKFDQTQLERNFLPFRSH
jgi:hypothetical protein